ncbi:hypothetical protein [Deferrisoma palaeochoriense]
MSNQAHTPMDPRRAATWAMRLLRRQVPDPSPEQKLWLAVIEHAVRDAYADPEADPARRAEARAWLESEYFTDVAVAIGLHPGESRKVIRRLAEFSLGVEWRVEPHEAIPPELQAVARMRSDPRDNDPGAAHSAPA